MKPENYPAEPAHLWQHFYAITQIPRPSKQEQAVRQYVIDQAEAGGHSWRSDEEGNRPTFATKRAMNVTTLGSSRYAHTRNSDSGRSAVAISLI